MKAIYEQLPYEFNIFPKFEDGRAGTLKNQNWCKGWVAKIPHFRPYYNLVSIQKVDTTQSKDNYCARPVFAPATRKSI